MNWSAFDEITDLCHKEKSYELAFTMAKVRFIFNNQTVRDADKLLSQSYCYKPQEAYDDILKLLNTNLHGPLVPYCLGKLCKELWYLENALMWFDQAKRADFEQSTIEATCSLEIADCLVWSDKDLKRALELLNFTSPSTDELSSRKHLTLAHAYLKLGDMKNATETLKEKVIDTHVPEQTFLQGLLALRNGKEQKAKDLWNTIFAITSADTKLHKVKEQIARAYPKIGLENKHVS